MMGLKVYDESIYIYIYIYLDMLHFAPMIALWWHSLSDCHSLYTMSILEAYQNHMSLEPLDFLLP